MPISKTTPLRNLPAFLLTNIAAYNSGPRASSYNTAYDNFIRARRTGITTHGGVFGWIQYGNAARDIHALLSVYGMGARASHLVPLTTLQTTLTSLSKIPLDWISGLSLPLSAAPCALTNPATGLNLSAELSAIYNSLSAPAAVTNSGGFVAASKALHCLFPDLAPMIDGAHSGLSYYHINRSTYLPPLKLPDWSSWIDPHRTFHRVMNPTPQGAGRHSHDADTFLAAIGINQHIYEIWQSSHRSLGLPYFISLDPTTGTTGIPRIIDKLLW